VPGDLVAEQTEERRDSESREGGDQKTFEQGIHTARIEKGPRPKGVY
jgi:hypothetical protein